MLMLPLMQMISLKMMQKTVDTDGVVYAVDAVHGDSDVNVDADTVYAKDAVDLWMLFLLFMLLLLLPLELFPLFLLLLPLL